MSDTQKTSRFRIIFRRIRIVILLAILAFACWYSYIWWRFDNMSQYEDWSEGLAVSQENGKYGYVDENFKYYINPQFDIAYPFQDGQAIVGMNFGNKKRFRVINKDGLYIGQFYDVIKKIGKRHYKVRNYMKIEQAYVIDKKTGRELGNLVDYNDDKFDEQFRKNEIILKTYKRQIKPSHEMYQNYQWQVMDNTGKILNKKKFNLIDHYREGRARVCIDKKCGFINLEGTIIIPLGKASGENKSQYIANFTDGTGVAKPFLNNSEYFNEGFSITRKDDKVGYIDKQGNIVIQPQFLQAKDFIEGLAVVKTKVGFGVINTKGKFVIPPNPDYQNLNSFSEGRAVFTQNGYKGVIDKRGNIIVPINLKLTDIGRFRNGMATIRRGNKHGFIDIEGNWVIPPIYEQLGGEFVNGTVWAINPDNPEEQLILDKNNNIIGRKKLLVF